MILFSTIYRLSHTLSYILSSLPSRSPIPRPLALQQALISAGYPGITLSAPAATVVTTTTPLGSAGGGGGSSAGGAGTGGATVGAIAGDYPPPLSNLPTLLNHLLLFSWFLVS